MGVTGSYSEGLKFLTGPTDIHFLAFFLNLDFDSVDQEKLKHVPLYGSLFVHDYPLMPKSEKERFPLCSSRTCLLRDLPVPHAEHSAFTQSHMQTFKRLGPLMWLFPEHERPDLVNKAKELQEELLTDIRLFVSEPKDFITIRNRLAEILRKANGLKITSRWALECERRDYSLAPGGGKLAEGEQWDVYYDPDDPNTVKPVINPRNRAFGPGERMLKIGDGKFVIRRWISGGDTPRQKLYGIITSALESGWLERLKRCLECQKFFVSDDPRSKYCTDACKQARDKRDAPNRMRRLRARKLEEERKQLRLLAERRNVERFSKFLKLARKRSHTNAELEKIRPLLKSIGRGEIRQGWRVVSSWEEELKKGRSPKELWESLPSKTKNTLANSLAENF